MHKKISVAIALAFIFAMLVSVVPVNAWVYPDCTEDDKVEFFGPRADKLIINFYANEIAEAIALEEGKIDFTDWPVTADYVTKWSQPPWNEKIKLVWRGTEFGMFQLDLNNNPNPYLGNPQNPAYPNPKYPNPMSVPALRHAIAHCIDKDYIVNTICGGYAERLDSYVPSCYGIWSNPNVEIHDFNLAEAAAILDAGGFPIGPTGWRIWSVTGEELNLDFFIRGDHTLRREAGYKIVEWLATAPVKIKCTVTEGPSSAARAKVMSNKDFHMYTGGWGLTADPDQGYFLYHIDTYWHPGRPLNYDAVNNTEHNYWTRKFITSTNFADALYACHKAQEVFCSPECIGAIPLWASAGYTAYRMRYTGGTDELPAGDGEDIYRGKYWKGVVNEKGFGTWSWYTFYNAHPSGFEVGTGEMTIRWGFRQPTLSLNPLYAEWVWDWYVLGKSYEGLIGLNPCTLEDVPGIAYKWEIGTWVPTAGPYAGETLSKVTFYLRDDVVWSDGVPVTAEDVKFTWGGPLDVGSISWWLEQRGFPPAYWSANVADILSVSTPDPWTVEVLLDTTSYFAHHGMSGWNIILPKHIWEPIVSGKPNPYGTDPTADSLVFGGPRVCTGPWIIGPYTGVEPSITLYQNPLHYENPRRKPPINKILRLKNPEFADRHIYRGELCLNEFELGLHNKWRNNGMDDVVFDVDKYIQVEKVGVGVVLPWTFLGHEDLPFCTWVWENLPTLTLTAGLYNIHIAIHIASPATYQMPIYVDPGPHREFVTQPNPWLNTWINQTYCVALPMPPTTEIPSYYFWVTIREDIAGTFFKQIGGKNYQDVPDLKVDMKDVGAAAKAFGSYPGHPRWNSYADINIDRKVDMKDIGAIAKKFGWKP